MRRFAAALAVLMLVAPLGADTLATREEIESFMRTAKVVKFKELSKGITRPLRLTLSDGTTTHDAVFQAVDQRKSVFQPQRGPAEVNFRDCWCYNVAAYRLSILLGLDSMMPVTIEYQYQGRTGALAWFMESLMDEGERLKKKIPVMPRHTTNWNQDMHRQRFFTELVRDSDRNLGNVLVSPEWRVIMLDFTRAFRLHDEIRPAELQRIDRQLLAKAETLTAENVKVAVEEYLNSLEIEALIKRRNRIVDHVKDLVAKQGEEKVFF